MQGRRLKDLNLLSEDGERAMITCAPGDYFKDQEGYWRGKAPNGLFFWLKNHHVEEHEDGTISVLPGSWGSNSILVSNNKNSWHGYIDHGVWKEC